VAQVVLSKQTELLVKTRYLALSHPLVVVLVPKVIQVAMVELVELVVVLVMKQEQQVQELLDKVLMVEM
jgi:hypothetical protein